MNKTEEHKNEAALSFFTGGGKMGALMRSHDWSASPLGCPASWPQSLRTVVGLILNAKFPMFIAWGAELGFLYNDAYAEILGAKHPAALGGRFREIWSEIWNDIDPLIMRALAGEATYCENMPLMMQRRGYEEQTWFTFSYSPVRDESGGVAGMYCTCTETTAHVLAEQIRIEENERLRRLFEQAPSFMAVLSGPDHIFELTNKTYLQLIGHRHVVGKPLIDAVPEVKGQGFSELLDRVYTTGNPFVGRGVPIKLQCQPGGTLEERFLDFVYQPIRDASGVVTGVFVEGSDVTDHKRALDELQASDRRKDEFLAMLAHELRNPLAPISTAAQLLKLKQRDDDGIRLAGDIIARQVEHMTDLVNDLLDVSRVTRGLITLDKSAIEVNETVSGAVEQVRGLIEARRHRLILQTPDEAVHVEGDGTRLIQVIANVLNNAAKFTPPGGEIMLRVDADDSEVKVTVRDNGAGISEKVLPYIFDLFTQAERTPDRSQGGLGLGLALVKSLVELHGGNVSAKSAGAGQGSEFTIRLPRLAKPAAGDHHQNGRADLKLDNDALRVMIVDDNTDAAQTLAMILNASGHHVMVEHDAKTALDRACIEKPQVLLLDIGLPDMDGYELARRFRSRPETAPAMLVALSGYGQSKDRERSRSAGFNHHLVKPADMSQLAAIFAQVNNPPLMD